MAILLWHGRCKPLGHHGKERRTSRFVHRIPKNTWEDENEKDTSCSFNGDFDGSRNYRTCGGGRRTRKGQRTRRPELGLPGGGRLRPVGRGDGAGLSERLGARTWDWNGQKRQPELSLPDTLGSSDTAIKSVLQNDTLAGRGFPSRARTGGTPSGGERLEDEKAPCFLAIGFGVLHGDASHGTAGYGTGGWRLVLPGWWKGIRANGVRDARPVPARAWSDGHEGEDR